jgi:hypothetical protein
MMAKTTLDDGEDILSNARGTGLSKFNINGYTNGIGDTAMTFNSSPMKARLWAHCFHLGRR